MTSLLNAIKSPLIRHREKVLTAKVTAPLLNTAVLVQLGSIALLCFVLAALGYASGGYHFGFATINNQAAHIPEWVLHNLTSFGDTAFVLALILLIANRQIQLHWVVFWAGIIGALVSNGLKEFFDASRPPAVLEAGTFFQFGEAYVRNSFPSGHTLTGFSLATFGYYYLNSAWKKAAALVVGCLVGLSRIWLGVHWPADALVGAGLGILTTSAGIYIGHRWQSGINPLMHRIILALFVLAALVMLLEKNDYAYALPLLYVTALLALWRTARNYLLPEIDTVRSPMEEDRVRLPLTNLWLNSTQVFWIFLALITAYRVLVLLQPHYSLFYDEAYYYHWSLNPDLGYYSKPPMVAWAILLSTSVFGTSELTVKLMSSLLYAATAAVLFASARHYLNATRGLLAGVVFLCIPMIGFNSEFITTDAPLLFFWALSLYYTLRALESNLISHWLLLGVFVGLGMLSKYTMGAFPLAVFLFLLFDNKLRSRLLHPGPWLAAVVAGLIFGLNIYWNFTHNWIAAQHTQEISQTSGALFNFPALLEFVASQFLIFGPVSSWVLVWSVAKTVGTPNTESCPVDFNEHSRIRLLIWVTGVILAAISLQAFLSRAFPNWAGPWMVGGTLLLVFSWQNAYSGKQLYKKLNYGFAFNLLLLSLLYHWPPVLNWLDVEPSRKNNPFQRLAGWPQLAEETKPVLDQYPSATLASDERDILAYIGYYARPGSFDFARWNPQQNNIRDYYDLKVNFRQFSGDLEKEYVFVSKAPLSDSVRERFVSARDLGEVSIEVYRDETMTLHITWLRGFKGYDD